MKIDLKKTYQTSARQEVRIYAIDSGGTYPVHGAIRAKDGIWTPSMWTEEGNTFVSKEPDARDLIETPLEKWHPIVQSKQKFLLYGGLYPTREEAMTIPGAIDAWKEPNE